MIDISARSFTPWNGLSTHFFATGKYAIRPKVEGRSSGNRRERQTRVPLSRINFLANLFLPR
jgi:hypothetical protein